MSNPSLFREPIGFVKDLVIRKHLEVFRRSRHHSLPRDTNADEQLAA